MSDCDLVFNYVEFKNFMSFGNLPTTVRLDNPGTTLVIGENLDDGGSSGAGKTTMLSAISYACFDKIPSGVSKDRLINQTNDKKTTSMEVCFSFTAKKHTYKVIRKRGAMGGIQLLEDDKDITPASVIAFNNKLEELLGFSFNMFSQVILFNGSSRTFLDSSVGEQRNLIEELFRITTLSHKANACKKRVVQTDKDIAIQKTLIQQQRTQNENYDKRVVEAKERANRWEVQRNKDAEAIVDNMRVLNEIDFDTNEMLLNEMETLQATLAPFQSEIRELNTRLSAKKAERFPKKTEMALLESNTAKKSVDVKKIDSELLHLIEAKCPYCLQKYENTKAKIAELEGKKATLIQEITDGEMVLFQLKADETKFLSTNKAEIAKLIADINSKQQETVDLTTGIDEIKSGLTYKTIKELTAAKNSVDVLQAQFTKLAESVNPHLESIESLINEGVTKVDTVKLEELLTLQEHQQFLIKLLMDKNSFIRKNIISKTLPFLNKRIGYYTEKLNLPHMIIFQSDMSCKITQYGRELDHGNLSNGEKKKLNLSICLAFRDVMTYLHSKVNVLFTDEIDGGSISGPDVDSLITLIKHKAWDDKIGIYVISHRPEFDGRCDRNLVVRKERGFSNLIVQPDE